MLPEWIKLGVQAFISVLAAYLAAKYTAKNAIAQIFKGKLWEQKHIAYDELINALHACVSYCECCANDFGDNSDAQETHIKQLGKKYMEGNSVVKKYTDIGAFVISENAHKVLRELRSRPEIKYEDNPRHDFYADQLEGYKTALEGIRKAARDELENASGFEV